MTFFLNRAWQKKRGGVRMGEKRKRGPRGGLGAFRGRGCLPPKRAQGFGGRGVDGWQAVWGDLPATYSEKGQKRAGWGAGFSTV